MCTNDWKLYVQNRERQYRMIVCMCPRERERERECVCIRQRERMNEMGCGESDCVTVRIDKFIVGLKLVKSSRFAIHLVPMKASHKREKMFQKCPRIFLKQRQSSKLHRHQKHVFGCHPMQKKPECWSPV